MRRCRRWCKKSLTQISANASTYTRARRQHLAPQNFSVWKKTPAPIIQLGMCILHYLRSENIFILGEEMQAQMSSTPSDKQTWSDTTKAVCMLFVSKQDWAQNFLIGIKGHSKSLQLQSLETQTVRTAGCENRVPAQGDTLKAWQTSH